MSDDQFDQFTSRVRATKTYSEILDLTRDCTIALDQRVRLEDVVAETFVSLLRDAEDREFINMVRQVNRDKPRWKKRIALNEIVREELDFRFLLAKLPRMGEEAEK